MQVYTQSKTAIVLFTEELARRLPENVTVNCVNPGLIHTNLGRDMRGPTHVFIALMRPFMKSANYGAKVITHLASAPELAGVSGKYFAGKKEGQAFPKPYDSVAAQQLWQVSEQLTRLYSIQD
jgi:retinol dehydrogenase 14